MEASKSFSFTGINIVFALCAYFVYGQSLSACLAVLLIGLVLGFLSFLGLIPIIGPIGYWLLGRNWFIPKVLGWAGISYAWPVSALFWLYFTIAIIFTIITTAYIWLNID